MIEERLPLDGDMSYTVVGGGIRDALDSLKNILKISLESHKLDYLYL